MDRRATSERTPDLAPERKERSPAALALGSSVTAGSRSDTEMFGLQRLAGNCVATSVAQRAWGKKKRTRPRAPSPRPTPGSAPQPECRTRTTPRIVAPTGRRGSEDTSTDEEKLKG